MYIQCDCSRPCKYFKRLFRKSKHKTNFTVYNVLLRLVSLKRSSTCLFEIILHFFQFLAPATLLTYWPPIRLAPPTRSRLEISPLLFTSPTPLGNTVKPFKPSRLSRIHPRKRSSPQSTFQTHKCFRWLEKMASLLLCIILILSKIAFMQS